MSNTDFDTLGNLNPNALYDSSVSVNNFSTSNEEITKSRKLEEARASKLQRLQQTKGKIDLDDSYTEMGNGNVESNQNKIWNSLSNNEFQSAFTYALDNNKLSRDDKGNVLNSDGSAYSGSTRRLYMYGSKDSTDDVVKLGLSRGDEDNSDSRYVRYPSGDMGVDINNKYLDVLLPEKVAITLEGMTHGREQSLKGRVLSDIYGDPETRESYGSGVTEYYNSKEALFGAPEQYDETLGRKVFDDIYNRPVGSSDTNGSFSQQVKQLEADNAGLGSRAINTAKGFGATFFDTLVASPLNAIGQLTGTYSFGEPDDVTESINNAVGYNDLHVQKTMEGLKEDWSTITSDEASLGQKLRAAGDAIVDSATTPELLGTSLGAIAAWVTPGSVLKALGKGTQLGAKLGKVDKLLKEGKITPAMAKGAKRKAYMSANGGKALAVNQSGQIWSSIGATNNQYNEFVKNNGGVELEGAEKAQWFAKAMTIQVMNQNLDKIVDINAMKAANLLPSIRGAAKSMSKDELSKVSNIMMGTVKGTAKAAGVVSASMLSEAAQEYVQTTMELYNEREGSEKYKDLDSFLKFVTNSSTIDEAGVAMLAGAGGAVQFNAAGKVMTGLSKAQKAAYEKVGNKILKSNNKGIATSSKEQPSTATVDEPLEVGEPEVVDTPSTEQPVLTPEEEQTIASNSVAPFVDAMFGNIDEAKAMNRFNPDTDSGDDLDLPSFESSVKKIIEEGSEESVEDSINKLDKAEAYYSTKAAGHKEKMADSEEEKSSFREARNYSKVARLAKREYLKHVMDKGITLGSGITPEDVIDDMIEASVENDKVNITEEEKDIISKYSEDNDIPASRWASFISTKSEGKDAHEVYRESITEGEKSASQHRAGIKNLLRSSNPDKEALAKAVGGNNRFLTFQLKRIKAVKEARELAKTKIVGFNKRYKDGNEPAIGDSTRKRLKQGVKVKGYESSYISITDDEKTGGLKIHQSSLNIEKSIQDTIDYLTRTNTRYKDEVAKILGKPVSGEGIMVRPNTTSTSSQDKRDKDESWYKTTGANKVIVDETSHRAVWSVDGDYRKDNAGIINTGKYKKGDVVLVVSDASKAKKGTNIFSELAKARKAGATVVVERHQRVKTSGIHNILKSRAHFHPAKVGVNDKSDGYTAYHPSKEIADSFTAVSEAKKSVRAEKYKDLSTLIKAVANKDTKVIREITDKHFKGDIEKANNYYETIVKKQTDTLYKEFLNSAVINGYNSSELNDLVVKANKHMARGVITEKAVTQALELLAAKVEEVQKGNALIHEWREALEESKKGNIDYNKWIEENVANPKSVISNLLENSVGNVTYDGNPRKAVKVKYDQKGDKWDIVPRQTKEELETEVIDENSPTVQIISLNPKDYLEVKKTTVLNSYNPSDIRVEGPEGAVFNSTVLTASKMFNEALEAPNLVLERDGKKPIKSRYLDLLDSPAAPLVFEVVDKESMELKVNDSVAVAIQIALGNLIKNNKIYLRKGQKSKKALAEMLGMDETMVTQQMVNLVGDKGMLYKNVANSVGKDIMSLLGLGRKSNSEVDSQAYDALVSDLGQMAVMVGIDQGYLERNDSVTAARYANVMLSKAIPDSGTGEGAKVMFINIVPNREEDASFMAESSRQLGNILPDTDVSRKEPMYKKPSKKEVDRIVENSLRNAVLDVGVSKESKEAMREMINTEWKVDLKSIRKALEDEEFIKKGLGYIEIDEENPEYKVLTHENKGIQKSINNDIEKGIEELKRLADNNEGDSMPIWFSYFFSTNGRFFMDSNTINPMTNKHMHRFFVQPKSHEFSTTYSKGKFKETESGKDITPLVHYAIAQGLGFTTDRTRPKEIEAFAEKAIKVMNTPAKVRLARKIFLGTSTEKENSSKAGQDIIAIGIEFEHYSQALQTFNFLEDLRTNKLGTPITSSLTAEFDAVTSGFGLKLLQLPLLEYMNKWMTKVGMVKGDDILLEKVGDQLSMNSLLDKDLGQLLDSYQELASNMGKTSFSDMIEAAKSKNKSNVLANTEYTKKVWEALYDVIPKKNVDGSVSSALRSLFKPGFMLFNYSASIKTIRSNLSQEIVSLLVKQMASAKFDSNTEEVTDNSKIVNLMLAYTNGNIDKAKDLQKRIRNEELYKIRSAGTSGVKLEDFLGQMIDASYGVQIEKSLTEAFEPFIETQNDINNAFKAMFEVFFAEVENKFTEARKLGPISKEDEKAIYDSVKDRWPSIKGPLASMEDEVLSGSIGIYDTETAAPNGVFSGRKPARAKVTSKLGNKLRESGQIDIRVSHMIRKMSAAVSAGSVVPIHHIDGAAIARTVNGSKAKGIQGLTLIHDAIMPPLVHANDVVKTYNESIMKLGREYSFVSEIASKIINVGNMLDWKNDKVLSSKTVMVKKQGMKKEEPQELEKFFKNSLSAIVYKAQIVHEKRQQLFSNLDATGYHIMHMAATPESVYSVKAGEETKPYKPIDLPKSSTYNSNPTINDMTMDDIDEDLQNLCP